MIDHVELCNDMMSFLLLSSYCKLLLAMLHIHYLIKDGSTKSIEINYIDYNVKTPSVTL